MKNLVSIYLLVLCSLFAKDPPEISTEAMKQPSTNITCVSEAFGHILGENIKNTGVQFDIFLVAKGMKDAIDGKQSPIPATECIQAIHLIQEKNFSEKCKENLEWAENFLFNNAKEAGVISIEGGKVQYRIIQQGSGMEVKPHFCPRIRYTLKAPDGSILDIENPEESISLTETISGLKAGLIGMKKGEKRIIYIHPDLAYGAKDSLIPPNLLLTFEIELLKLNEK